jgi:bifunctional non-homologous end joining protein LigD
MTGNNAALAGELMLCLPVRLPTGATGAAEAAWAAWPRLDEWALEPKLDGVRVLLRVLEQAGESQGGAELFLRSGDPCGGLFPDLLEVVRQSGLRPGVYDGIVVCHDRRGQSSLRALRWRFDPSPNRAERARRAPAALVLFDLLQTGLIGGVRDVRNFPLSERRRMLERVVGERAPGDALRLMPRLVGEGLEVYHKACARREEGIIAKRLGSVYRRGRSRDWLKIRCGSRQEFIVGGYTESRREPGGVGPLLVGVHQGGNSKILRYAGVIAKGFVRSDRDFLQRRLARPQRETSPFDFKIYGSPPKLPPGIHWVDSDWVIEAEDLHWASHDSFQLERGSRFVGFRFDKSGRDLIEREQARELPWPAATTHPSFQPFLAEVVAGGKRPSLVRLTNLNEIVYPALGATRGEVIEYYQSIVPRLMPYLRNRPIVPEMVTTGLEPLPLASWVPRVIVPGMPEGAGELVLISDSQTLLYLVGQGAISFHAWSSRIENIDNPDVILFDLNPVDIPFQEVVRVARSLGERLRERRIGFAVKTSGKTGLHLLSEWRGEGGYTGAREFAELLAAEVVQCSGGLARLGSPVPGSVVIEVGLNVRGQPIVPPFVLRPGAEARVSMPVSWHELNNSLDPANFTLRTAIAVLGRQSRLKKGDAMNGLMSAA